MNGHSCLNLGHLFENQVFSKLSQPQNKNSGRRKTKIEFEFFCRGKLSFQGPSVFRIDRRRPKVQEGRGGEISGEKNETKVRREPGGYCSNLAG